MGIGTDHHASGKCIVLQHHLVNDTGAGLPEADAVFVGYRFQKIEYFSAGA
jgi:hypothetical protein